MPRQPEHTLASSENARAYLVENLGEENVDRLLIAGDYGAMVAISIELFKKVEPFLLSDGFGGLITKAREQKLLVKADDGSGRRAISSEFVIPSSATYFTSKDVPHPELRAELAKIAPFAQVMAVALQYLEELATLSRVLAAFYEQNPEQKKVLDDCDNYKQLMAAYLEKAAPLVGVDVEKLNATVLAAFGVVLGAEAPSTDTNRVRDLWRKVKGNVPAVLKALEKCPRFPFQWMPLEGPLSFHYLSPSWRAARQAWLAAQAVPQSPNPPGSDLPADVPPAVSPSPTIPQPPESAADQPAKTGGPGHGSSD